MGTSDQQLLSRIRVLAKLHRVQTSFDDASGVKRTASVESLARVLGSLGSPCATEAEADASIRTAAEAFRVRRLEPVQVAWDGEGASFALKMPASGKVGGVISWSLAIDGSRSLRGEIEVSSLKTRGVTGPDGWNGVEVLAPLPKGLPAGYHKLTIEHAGEKLESLVISAPTKSFREEEAEPGAPPRREWGVFCPLYALRSEATAGYGDLSDLRELVRWSAEHGGRVVSTLPLLASFLGERPGPFDPSPYAPVSRLFWNELLIDPARAPEFGRSAEARALLSSSSYLSEASELRSMEYVDYRRTAALKRSVLERLAGQFEKDGGRRTETFKAFQLECPLATEYAAFRAVTERQKKEWGAWPEKLQRGAFGSTDYDPSSARYHQYVQYLAWMELLAFGSEVKSEGGLIYLDMPIGVSPFGYDAWKFRDQFASSCSTGAPPDPYFTSGQNWGFPPMHPESSRTDGYGYLRQCLRNHMRHADYLRLDHVMAFHRLYWIPTGMSAEDGVYVGYRAEELYAVLSLESHRNRCRLVGENLGTVPPEVNEAIQRHDLCGLYVAQYEMQPKAPGLRAVPENCVASINTHDMATLATTWSGADVDHRIGLNLLDKSRRAEQLGTRAKAKKALVAMLQKQKLLAAGKSDAASVRDALLNYMAQSPADIMLVNLEDLWLEERWQNVPGTTDEHPNWRCRCAMTLEEIFRDSGIARVLRSVEARRRKRVDPTSDGKAPKQQAAKSSSKPKPEPKPTPAKKSAAKKTPSKKSSVKKAPVKKKVSRTGGSGSRKAR